MRSLPGLSGSSANELETLPLAIRCSNTERSRSIKRAGSATLPSCVSLFNANDESELTITASVSG